MTSRESPRYGSVATPAARRTRAPSSEPGLHQSRHQRRRRPTNPPRRSSTASDRPFGDHRGRSSDADSATTERHLVPSAATTAMSKPAAVTKLYASCEPSTVQAGLMPRTGCGRSGCSTPVSGRPRGARARRCARCEADPRAVRRPLRLVVQPRRAHQLPDVRTVDVQYEDVPVAVPVGAEGQSTSVRRPTRVEVRGRVAGDLRQSRPVWGDQVDVARSL
jgi:hypothetical protein